MKNFNMTKIVVMVVIVFFSTFIFTACGGKEPNNPDEESKTDTEVINENSDESVDETSDESVDEENPDETSDEDIIYEEITSEEECLASDCKELCFLRWQNNSEIEWYGFYSADESDDGEDHIDSSIIIDFPLFKKNTGEKCYVDIYINKLKKVQAKKMPIEPTIEEYGYTAWYSYSGNKNMINEKESAYCINEETGYDYCENWEEEIVGQKDGKDYFLGRDNNYVPVKN